MNNSSYREKKKKNLIQFYDKGPYIHRKIQKTKWQHKNAPKNFDHTTIADRLRTVSWSNDGYPTDAVKPVNGIITFQLTAKAVLSKGHTFKILLIETKDQQAARAERP